MKTNLKALAGLVLISALAAGQAQTVASGTTSSSSKKTTARKHARAKKPAGPSVETQIEGLRQEFNSQIQSLKQQLSDRDAQLQSAQQAAAAAQAAAQQAQQAAQTNQQALTENTTAVTSLQSAVGDMKTNTATIVSSMQDDQKATRAAIENPTALHYKGITLSPAGSFIEAATVYRSAATGGGINTPFTGIPLEHSDAGHLSEFFGSARQSRVALKAVGKLDNMTLTGYYEADWLGTGITSNNNQSNSYVLRQRQIWAQAAMAKGWTITTGQMWSLATETTQGLSNGTEILPSTIDPQYTAGFTWERQYGFRVSKDFGKKMFIGLSAENPQTLTGGSNPTNQTLGGPGVGGGLYNLNANYSFNVAPDFVFKAAFEPGWGHWEVFGVGRFFRNRVYSAPIPYNDTTVGGGIGGGFRVPLAQKKLTVGLKGLYGDGTGRYGDATIADITFRPDGQIAVLHNFSALATIEANPTKRLNLYLNYGGDYVGRRTFGSSGYGSRSANMSGCNAEAAPGGAFLPGTTGTCAGNNKDVQEITAGYWYNFYNGPKGRLRQGIQYSHFERDLWSGAGGITNPSNGAKGIDDAFWTSFRYYLP